MVAPELPLVAVKEVSGAFVQVNAVQDIGANRAEVVAHGLTAWRPLLLELEAHSADIRRRLVRDAAVAWLLHRSLLCVLRNHTDDWRFGVHLSAVCHQ